MGLNFIIGDCGYGKTTTCVRKIAELEQSAKNIILIVPQQFTLETERMLLETSRAGAIIKTRVLSFKRLAYVLLNDGAKQQPTLSTLGKTFLLRKIVYENRDNLGYFSKVIDKQGFLDNLVNLITEFYQYSITPEMLETAIENTNPTDILHLKLKDICIIYTAYRQYLENRYTVSEENLDIVAQGIGNSDYIKQAHIFIDGFNYFIPQEYNIIRQLMMYARDVTITFDGNFSSLKFGKYNAFDPYFESKHAINRLLKMAEECGCAVGEPMFLSDNQRHKEHPDFLHLQKNYFARLPEKFNGVPQNIKLIKAKNSTEEINFVCREIIRLVKAENLRYDSIAVIIEKDYEQDIKQIFNAYNLPVFLDTKRPVANHPLTELIVSVLDILCYGFENKRLFRYFKNTFSPLGNEVDYLENYTLKHNINTFAWKKKVWSYGFESTENEKCIMINNAKNTGIDSLKPLTDNIKAGKKYSPEYIINTIYDFLLSLGADKKLDEMIEAAKEENDQNLLRQHSRIWDEILNIFETMAAIINDEMDIMEFTKVLNSGLSVCSISIIPPSQDNIIIGDIDRSRLPQIKVLFMLGVNEGKIPPFVDDIGVFSDRERTALTEGFFEMSADNVHKINLMDFSIYSLLLKPEKLLYLSSTSFDKNGKRMAVSYVVSRFLKLFEKISYENLQNNDFVAPSADIAFGEMVKGIRQGYETGVISPETYDSYYWFSKNNAYEKQINMIEDVFDEILDDGEYLLNDQSVKKLYGNEIYGSVTRLESFAKCPFAYFLKYGLKVSEREQYEFDNLRMGNVFHSVIEAFSSELQQENREWTSLEREEINNRVSKNVDSIIPESFNDIVLQDPKFQYTIQRVKNTVSQSIWALSRHIRAGSFKPVQYEVGFGLNSALPPIVYELDKKRKIVLNGKIDRVDIMQIDDKGYVKIIDYKPSNRSFSPEELYYGTQLQLILYMDSYIKANKSATGKNLLPGGMFYFRVSNPMVENNDEYENVEKLIMQEYQMNGLVLNDENVLLGIDKNAKGKENDKTVGKSTKIVSQSDFMDYFTDTAEIVKSLGSSMLEGDISIKPFKTKDKTGCDYCEFSNACRFCVRENAQFREKPVVDIEQ